MIKFIDFSEVWFLSESVARVAAIVGHVIATRIGHVAIPHVAKVNLFSVIACRLGGLEEAFSVRKPKFVGWILTGVDRLSGCENDKHARDV
ncbi:hypothetical protein TNCV_838241 [Trichonephila clavipes]|nr:hypothetical protein TNCV_838241 [Trichonephila clavipes]